jgi:hypothetical protein
LASRSDEDKRRGPRESALPSLIKSIPVVNTVPWTFYFYELFCGLRLDLYEAMKTRRIVEKGVLCVVSALHIPIVPRHK